MVENLQTTKELEKVFEELKTNINGLTDSEAKERLAKYGKNELVIKKISVFSVWLRQFKNAMIYLLFVAAAISLSLKEFVDAIIIFVIVLINSTIGFFQEYKTEKILEKLKSFIKVRIKVRRNGKLKELSQEFIVPGDIVLIQAGDLIPADIRLFKSNGLMVNEEVLTGESYPVEKAFQSADEEKNTLFSGSMAVKGWGEGVVVAIGKNTMFGKIAELTFKTTKESIFEKSLLRLSKLIMQIVLATLAIVFILNLIIKGLGVNIPEFLLFAVALAVSVVPEALPFITTITLSRGAVHLAKNKVVVKRLSAIEDLGNIEIICSDKTGTLTENNLTVEECVSDDKERCLLFAFLASEFSERVVVTFDPFDLAIKQAFLKEVKEKEDKNFKKIWKRPFDPNKRSNAVVVENLNGERFLIVRGAVEEILSLCKPSGNYNEIVKQFQERGKQGQRTLAIAFKKVEKKESCLETDERNLNYLGSLFFFDPLKPQTISTIKEAKKIGVAIKIITGDAPEVAETVAKKAGLEIGQKIITSHDLLNINEEQLANIVENNNVFARILPEQKYKIIKILQQKYVVAFLGEGINDAPALKLANVAIVVDSGADISKGVGDIILIKKDLKVIIDGIREGRTIFANVTKYIRYTLIANFGNFYSMAIISLILPFLPMLAVQILLVNLLSDIPLIAVSTDKVDQREIQKPKKYNLREIAFSCIFLGLISSIFDFTFFALFYKTGPETLRTLWFICSILTELALIFSIRTRYFVFKSTLPSLTLVVVSFVAAFLTIFTPLTKFGRFFHFVSPSISFIWIIFGLVVLYFIATEIVKLIYYRRQKEF